MAFHSVNLAHLTKFNSAASSDFIDFYEKLVDAEIVAQNAEPKHRTFAPSSFRCPRINWFRLRGVQPDKISKADRGLNFSAEIGTACHENIQRRLKAALKDDWIDVGEYLKTIDVGCEYSVEQNGFETLVEFKNPPVRFACDGLIRWQDELTLVEIKSSDHDSFDDLMDIKEKHVDQVRCYTSLIKVNRALVFYVDRVYGEHKCFERRYTSEDHLSVKQEMQRIMDLADACIAPEGLPKGDANCTSNMCPYYNKCKEWGR